MTDHFLRATAPASSVPARRRLVAAGIIRRRADRALPVPATTEGTTAAPRTAALLRQIAEHLSTHRPTAPMTDGARLTVAFGIAGSAPAASPLLRMLPWPEPGITRGEYALRLRKTAWAADTDAEGSLTALASAVGVLSARTFEDGDDACPACGSWTSPCPCAAPTGSTTRTPAVTR
ncbi:hypothetical protein ACWCXE_20080 [Streptomyces sp. NPDC001780]